MPATVDLSAQSPEAVGHPLNLVDHDEPTLLLIEMEVGFFQDPTIGAAFHVKAASISRIGDLKGEGGLADLRLAAQGHARLMRQCVLAGRPVTALDHAWYLFQCMEDLLSWSRGAGRCLNSASHDGLSIRLNHR